MIVFFCNKENRCAIYVIMLDNKYLIKFAELTLYDDPDKYKRRGMLTGALSGGILGTAVPLIATGLNPISLPVALATGGIGALAGGSVGYAAGSPIDAGRKLFGINLKKVKTVDDEDKPAMIDPSKPIKIDPNSIQQLIEVLKREGHIK